MRVGFLHLAPMAGDLVANQERLRKGIRLAADHGAKWILTPELSTSGYTFHNTLGLDWIGRTPDRFAIEVAEMAASLRVCVFLGTAERDQASGLLYNSIQVFDCDRGLVGSHRKINTLKVGSEAWASSGISATVVKVGDDGCKLGLIVCADACSSRLGAEMTAMGAEAILSSANWAPGEWGPAGEWEAMSASTGLPVFVCNRTGGDAALSFAAAETVVVAGGFRQLSFHSPDPALVVVDWDFGANKVLAWRQHGLS